MKVNLKKLSYFTSAILLIGTSLAFNKTSHNTPSYKSKNKTNTTSQLIVGKTPTISIANQPKSNQAATTFSLSWNELGPDNIGGRTRAICFDKKNQNTIYAGGNSGGLFKTTDGGSNWTPVNDQLENMIINCITQDASGDNIYFGTGESQALYGIKGNGNSGFKGTGLYKFNIASNTISSVSSTVIFSNINKVVCHKTNNNTLFLATANNGFKISSDGGLNWQNAISNATSLSVATTGSITDLKVSSDGSYIFSRDSLVYISLNGDNFVNNISPSSTILQASKRKWIEFAFAPSDPNVVYASCVDSLGLLGGVLQSVNKGQTWFKIPTAIQPFSSINGKGNYNNSISVDPTNAYRIFLGGFSFSQWVGNAQGVGTWFGAATLVDFGFQSYVHSNVHALVWDPFNASRLFIGTDGGIFRTTNSGQSFTAINKGFNVTQAYSVSFERYPVTGNNGKPIAGAVSGNQANGTTHISSNFNGTKGAYSASDGDGGYCDFSHIAPTALFSSDAFGRVRRIAGVNATAQGSDFTDVQYSATAASNNGGPGSRTFANFVTPIRLWEGTNETTSIDSVDFVATTVNNNNVATVNGSQTIFKTRILKSNLGSIFDTLFVTLGASKIAVKISNPVSNYTTNVGGNTINNHDFTASIAGITTTITTSNFWFLDSVVFKFSTPPSNGVAFKTEMTQKYTAGTLVKVKSAVTSNTTFDYLLTVNVQRYTGKIRVPDYLQARLAVGLSGKVVVVKRPLDFGKTPDWVTVASSLSRDETNASSNFTGTVQTMAWSPDGDNLYVGTTAGSVYRISHLKQLIDSVGDKSSQAAIDADFNGIDTIGGYNTSTPLRCTRIAVFADNITSISVSPDDGKRIVVTCGSYNSNPHIYFASNPQSHPATAGAGLFVSKMGTGLVANDPVYSSLVEFNDTKRVFIGTEHGLYATSNITAATPIWTKENNDTLPNSPVLMIRQQTRSNSECTNSGIIYVATHGRGIWACNKYYVQTFVGINEIAAKNKTIISTLKLYPNPTTAAVNIAFNIEKPEQLTIAIYDLRGVLVMTKNLGKLPEGEQLFEISTQDLTSGTYIVNLNSSSTIVASNRLVVIK